jgi:hypothetical protein
MQRLYALNHNHLPAGPRSRQRDQTLGQSAVAWYKGAFAHTTWRIIVMLQSDISQAAHALFVAHGAQAEAEAAQKARDAQNTAESRRWDKIRHHLQEMHATEHA